jgi:hypothetical protein
MQGYKRICLHIYYLASIHLINRRTHDHDQYSYSFNDLVYYIIY